MKKKELKRISLVVREDQYERLNEMGMNVSGLVRDLIDDYLSEHKIVLSVSEETAQTYGIVISQTNSSDEELEVYLKSALKKLLKKKIQEMQELEKKL